MPSSFHCFLKISALCADAGNEDGQVFSLIAYAYELLWRSRTDDKSTVAVSVPFLCNIFRDDLVEPSEICAIDEKILEFSRSRVRGAAEHKDTFVLFVEKWLQSFAPKIWVDGDRINLQIVERSADITIVGISNIGALRVEDDRNVRVQNIQNRHAQCFSARFAPRLVKGDIRFVCARNIFRRVNDFAVEVCDCRNHAAVLVRRLRNLPSLAIKSYADEFPFGPLCFDQFSEITSHL